MDIVPIIVLAVVPAVGAAAFFLGRKYTGKAEALEAVFLAVNEVAQVYVEARKKLSEDGTLTSEEKKIAMSMAITRATEIAKGPGLKYIQAQSPAWLKSMIEYFVARSQGKTL